jgi:hypothetical protein
MPDLWLAATILRHDCLFAETQGDLMTIRV